MDFEWDEGKALTNIEKHGIDFFDAMRIWDGPVIDPAGERIVEQEYRPTALGTIGDDDFDNRSGLYGAGRRGPVDQCKKSKTK